MRWGRLCRYAIALGISRTSKPSPSSWRTRSSRRRALRPTFHPLVPGLAHDEDFGQLLVLDVQARRLEPPARDLGDQIGRVAKPLERRLRHVLEEAWRRSDGLPAMKRLRLSRSGCTRMRIHLGLARRRAAALVAEDAHLAESLARLDRREDLLRSGPVTGLETTMLPSLRRNSSSPGSPRPEQHVSLAGDAARGNSARGRGARTLRRPGRAGPGGGSSISGQLRQLRPADGAGGHARAGRSSRWPIASA